MSLHPREVKKDVRIALAVPEYQLKRERSENLGIAYVHASLRAEGYDDAMLLSPLGELSNDEILLEVSKFKPDLVGLSLTSSYMLDGFNDLATRLKEAGTRHVVAGGHYLMFAYSEVMQQCPSLDAIVIGEGEQTLVETAKALSEGRALSTVRGLVLRVDGSPAPTEPRQALADLDALPHPTRTTGLQVYNVSASRGCYTTCAFCSVPQFARGTSGRALRLRSVESVADELRLLRKSGAVAISFIDDVFLLPGQKGIDRAKRIADAAADAQIHWGFSCRTPELSAEIVEYCRPRGLCNIGLGLESGSERVLARLSKRASIAHSESAIQLCRAHDISVQPFFIMFEPDMSVDDLVANVQFLSKFGLLWPTFANNELDAYPGTPAHARLAATGRLRPFGHVFRCEFADAEVRRVKEAVQAVLPSAFSTEMALRREEFKADITEGIEGRSARVRARQRLTQLSAATLTLFSAVLHGRDGAESFRADVLGLGADDKGSLAPAADGTIPCFLAP